MNKWFKSGTRDFLWQLAYMVGFTGAYMAYLTACMTLGIPTPFAIVFIAIIALYGANLYFSWATEEMERKYQTKKLDK